MDAVAKDVDALISAAVRAQSQGRASEAASIARQVLEARPNDLQAMLLSGMLAVQRNDPAVAVPVLQRALQTDPSSADAPFWLSVILRRHGRLGEALQMAERTVAKDPKNEQAQNQLGMCLLDSGQAEQAVACLTVACQLGPRVGPFFDNLGRALQAAGRNDEAIDAFRQALSIGPVGPGLLLRLGDAYMNKPEPEAAAECAKMVLQREPNSATATLLLARAAIGAGHVDEGAKYALRAVELSPGNAVPVAYYGRSLQSLGRIQEADEQFMRSIELEPRQGFAYYALVHNHKVKEDERPLVSKMRELVKDRGLPKREIIQLEYGLGKACEDLGDYAEAMEHFDRANRIDHELKVGVAPFEKKQLEETADFLLEMYKPAFFEHHRSSGAESEMPIFVVGMMRSGTTLAEQILSSHPEVGGAGEQPFWPDNVGASQKLFREAAPGEFAVRGGALDVPRMKALSDEYLRLLSSIAPGKQRVVDKMNTNYLLLGLLHVAFPNARIVHMRRHSVDTCLSIWATPVANGIDLCASKDKVVAAYEQYLRIMEHWRSVLPSDRLLDVQYEELVSDQKRVTREMVDFCGLEWSDACLRPEQNKRSVKTPSVWQVRQPVYKTSMERWRKYEPWLGEFGKLLP